LSDDKLARWNARFRKAADLLSRRLDNPPSLAELAAAAAISPFHFHRMWRALTGETVGQTILRLRMEASEQLLLSKDTSVTKTAMAMGYGTPQSFARAFRRHSGGTPSEHRSAHQPVPTALALHVEIEQRGKLLVVALRREGKAYTDLNATFGRVWAWAEAAGVLQNLEGIYGVPLDDPQSVPESALRYAACLALGNAKAPEPFHMIELPDGDYARARHLGAYDGLEAATQSVVSEWLLQSDREPADFPIIHQFLNDPDETAVQDLKTDILLPLAPKKGAKA
jgi:AraC family transcriptional regulator